MVVVGSSQTWTCPRFNTLELCLEAPYPGHSGTIFIFPHSQEQPVSNHFLRTGVSWPCSTGITFSCCSTSKSQLWTTNLMEQTLLKTKDFHWSLEEKIQSWQNVSTTELLPNNLELSRHILEVTSSSSCSSGSSHQRELTNNSAGLLALSECFSCMQPWFHSNIQLKWKSAIGIPDYNNYRSSMFSWPRQARRLGVGGFGRLGQTPPPLLVKPEWYSNFTTQLPICSCMCR